MGEEAPLRQQGQAAETRKEEEQQEEGAQEQTPQEEVKYPDQLLPNPPTVEGTEVTREI